MSDTRTSSGGAVAFMVILVTVVLAIILNIGDRIRQLEHQVKALQGAHGTAK